MIPEGLEAWRQTDFFMALLESSPQGPLQSITACRQTGEYLPTILTLQ